jgi:predicted nucleic acid-binding protein
MNVVDSSAWLEYFANGPNASFFAAPIEQSDELVVPSLTIYEVFKRVLQQRDEGTRCAPSPSCCRARWSISTLDSP